MYLYASENTKDKWLIGPRKKQTKEIKKRNITNDWSTICKRAINQTIWIKHKPMIKSSNGWQNQWNRSKITLRKRFPSERKVIGWIRRERESVYVPLWSCVERKTESHSLPYLVFREGEMSDGSKIYERYTRA